MSEIYGPQTYKQYLESNFSDINPDCHCTQSRVARSRGIKLVMQGAFAEEEARAGVAEVLGDCPRSKAVGLCCDVVAKCTNVELIDLPIDEIGTKVEEAATIAAFNIQGGYSE
jgi:hypothetical protein